MSYTVPIYRMRAYRRRVLAQASAPARRQSARLHLKRTSVQIIPWVEFGGRRSISAATLLLSELSMRGVFVFCSEPLIVGSSVAVTIEHPKAFYVRGKVVSCKETVRNTSVISERSWSYRVAIAFEFRTIDEKIALKKYLDQIAKFNLDASVVL